MADEQSDADKLPTCAKWTVKIGTVILASISLILGVFTLISAGIKCVFAGIILIVFGVILIGLEAPILCTCITCMTPIANFSARRAPWQKLVVYIIPPIGVLILCQSLYAIFGSIAQLSIAFLYLFFVVQRART